MPAPDTVYRLRTRGTQFGQRVEFGMHFTRPPGTSPTSNLLAAWVASTMPLVVAATSATVNWDGLLLSDVSPAGAEQVIQTLTQPNPGAVAGDCLPSQNAGLIRFTTGLKGGRHRGRIYIPGIAEASNVNGVLGGAQLTAIQALAAGLVTQYGPGGSIPVWRLCVYSPIDITPPPAPKFKPKPDELVTPITASTTLLGVKSQRRRMVGVGI